MRDPKIILLDEPFEGLAPIIVRDLMNACRNLAAGGQTILVVEQNLAAALTLAHRPIFSTMTTSSTKQSPDEIKGAPDVVRRWLGV
jgi:branched-chain amino acid transport system ATP-binding protein